MQEQCIESQHADSRTHLEDVGIQEPTALFAFLVDPHDRSEIVGQRDGARFGQADAARVLFKELSTQATNVRRRRVNAMARTDLALDEQRKVRGNELLAPDFTLVASATDANFVGSIARDHVQRDSLRRAVAAEDLAATAAVVPTGKQAEFCQKAAFTAAIQNPVAKPALQSLHEAASASCTHSTARLGCAAAVLVILNRTSKRVNSQKPKLQQLAMISIKWEPKHTQCGFMQHGLQQHTSNRRTHSQESFARGFCHENGVLRANQTREATVGCTFVVSAVEPEANLLRIFSPNFRH